MVVPGYLALDLSAKAYQDAPAYIVDATRPGEYFLLPFSAASFAFPARRYGSFEFTPGAINVVFSDQKSAEGLLGRMKSGEVQLLVPEDLPTSLTDIIKGLNIISLVPRKQTIK